MSGILLASDEKSVVGILTKLLKTEGYKVIAEADLSKAMKLVKSEKLDLVITVSGSKWDPELKLPLAVKAVAHPPMIVIAENSSTELTARINQLHPFACLGKPLKIDKLMLTIQQAIDFGGTQNAAVGDLDMQLETCYQFQDIVAESPAMKSVCDMISRVAATDVTVLIEGENGAGKSVLAKTLHTNSRRKGKELVVVDCGSASVMKDVFGADGKPGALEKCIGATLFLDHVDKLSKEGQAGLCKILTEKKLKSADAKKEILFETRIIVSANEALELLAKKGAFLPELIKLFRVILVRIPPLRDRKEDIIPTMKQVLRNKLAGASVLPVIDPAVMDLFAAYSWPGNINEMKLVLDHALKASAGKRISVESLPPQFKTLA